MAPPPMRDSAVSPCFHGCLAFPHRPFPPQSPPSHPLDLPLCTVNSGPRPGIAPQPLNSSSQPSTFQGTCVPVRGMRGCGKDYLILIPFRLPRISCFTLSLKCFSSDSRQLPQCGDRTSASLPPPAEGRSGPTNTPAFPPSFFILPSFAWFYMFFSSGEVLLSTLSWCSARTSVSEVVFLMYPWREMYSMSTYSSTVSLCLCFLICCLGS